MEIINSIQEVLSMGLAFVVYLAIPAFIIFRAIRRKKLPSNQYTPLDDILDGKVRDPEEENDSKRTD
ncbi:MULTISPECIES: hypothetical protein [Bacillaceae]|uniref:hypothetical protein n=1 Tax=Bacillaceae TaxID=186817 RepID=UPI001C593F74|nr:hypothetical protein [Rossellomorea sp. YZS02]MBW3111636.1 hypothetical protein [Bacillus sp. MCCB 382]MDX8342233.1 hypothetical protein [Rossellomorea sp. YZS02]